MEDRNSRPRKRHKAPACAPSLVAYEGADADPVERWFCETSDARTDPEITEAVVRFIEQHGARSVVGVDRIIGCPHEEGIDYPDGETSSPGSVLERP
ncbi:hypothetical protein [Paraburkholderia sp. CI3]|uniref:hypothetical protein n=1 Tax=Paraburkholderia sp. CI3 TaxID=2991060 RepID=UPI003D1FA2EF